MTSGEALARLVYQLKTFTEAEIAEELTLWRAENNASDVMDRAVSTYLKDLWDMGYLDYRNGIYTRLS